MKKIILLNLNIFLGLILSYAQPNCEAFKYYGDTLKYEACKKVKMAKGHYQFSRRFQEIMDESLEIDSTFDYAYRAKSVAYLKSGDFLTWKKLMDKAVQYDTLANLGYRGWCRYQFFRDYRGAIADIELLDSLVDYNIGYSANGDYHLNIAKAICYLALGQKQKALQIVEKQLQEPDYSAGLYDYLYLGVLNLSLGQYAPALKAFQEQSQRNELADNQYYLALTHQALGNQAAYREALAKAKDLYPERNLFDPYTHHYVNVYLTDIDEALQKSQSE